jgi:3-carboxy-cis,cis-muconate cycloisomerase
VFAGLYARGGAAAAVGRRAWLQAMLDAEAALARACAAEGLVPQASADAIAAACRAERFDEASLEQEAAAHATPVVGLVRALRDAVGPDVAPDVHLGATSQDIVDTAAMLVARRALEPILGDAAGAADAAARLADAHRLTPMAGRTLLQQALPTTFGLRAAGWLVGLDEAREEVEAVREARLAVQMGGPVGHRDPAIADRVAALLDLGAPTLPWQAIRVRVAELAAALGALSGVLAKIARDVTLLAQDEVGEVREGGEGRGASSAMGHKRNPVAAVSVLACATRVPGLVATLLGAMEQEHERAAGRWQAEAGTLSDVLALTGSAAAWGRDLLEHLEVDPARMAANLRALADAGVAEAADPAAHLGAAGVLVDRALEAHRA